MTPPKSSHRAKPSTAALLASDWWVKDCRIFVPVSELTGANNVVDKPLPLPLRNALQRYARELASKVRNDSTKKCANEQVEGKRGRRRKGLSHDALGLMDVVLAARCSSK